MDSKELGLALGLLVTRYFLKTDHLHYGYWPEGLEVDIQNFAGAQEHYTQFLLSHLPDGVRSVLDVGCGTGVLSRRLLDAGYQVESVSPSAFLNGYARDNIGPRGKIYHSTYEDLQTDARYDLVLCAESFQYLDLDRFFDKTRSLLNSGGHVLISDVFKRDVKQRASGLGGGHNLTRFYADARAAGFEALEDVDITEHTAPTMDVAQDLLSNVIVPLGELLDAFMGDNYPRIQKLVKWKFRKKLAKWQSKYALGRRNATNFAIDKSYRLMVYRMAERPEPSGSYL